MILRILRKHYLLINSDLKNFQPKLASQSFFHTLKTEEVYWKRYNSREEAKKSIFEYIEINYNRKRLHSGINYKTPVEFEKLYNHS